MLHWHADFMLLAVLPPTCPSVMQNLLLACLQEPSPQKASGPAGRGCWWWNWMLVVKDGHLCSAVYRVAHGQDHMDALHVLRAKKKQVHVT